MESDQVHGGEIVVRSLVGLGVRTVFGLTGGHIHPILDSLLDHDIRLIDMRHEAALVHAADAYARVSGGVGVALVTAGPGVANAVAGLATAFEACSPVVVIAGDVNSREVDRGALQESDELRLVAPVTKWARRVGSVDRLPEYLERAFHFATTGRPGPTFLTVASDVLGDHHSSDLAPAKTHPLGPPHPAPGALDAAFSVLSRAQRPLMIVGSGARWSPDAVDSLAGLAAVSGIPALGKNFGRGVVPEDMELGIPYDYARVAIPDADAIALFGTRLNWMLGFGRSPRFNDCVRLIQFDVHPEEIGRNRNVEVPVVGDVAAAAQGLSERFRLRGATPKDRTWLKAILQKREEALASVSPAATGSLHPLEIAGAMAAILPEEAIVVGDGANVLNWGKAVLRVHRPGSWLEHAPFGAMGVGIPFAIGARSASEDMARGTGAAPRPVFALSGDGAFGFFPMELQTAVRHRLPFVMVVANDGGWGADRNTQLVRFGRNAGVDFGDVRHDQLACALGAWGVRVSDRAALADVLAEAVASNRPAVVDAVTDPGAGAERRSNPMLEFVLER